MDINTYKQIVSWAAELDGVFTVQDLKIAFNKVADASRYRAIQELTESGELIKIKRGYYATPNATLIALAARMYPDAYISTGTVLASKKLIGSIPERKIQVVRIGTPSSITCSLGVIEALSIAPKLFFGFERMNGAYWASAEKAYLDSCYFYYKGKRFSFDLACDVNINLLNRRRVERDIKAFDKRFTTFFQKNFWSNR